MGANVFFRWAVKEGFMAPDEVAVTPPIPGIPHVVIVLDSRGSCAEYHLVSDQFTNAQLKKKSSRTYWKSVLKGSMKDQTPNEIARHEAAHFRKYAAAEQSVAPCTWSTFSFCSVSEKVLITPLQLARTAMLIIIGIFSST